MEIDDSTLNYDEEFENIDDTEIDERSGLSIIALNSPLSPIYSPVLTTRVYNKFDRITYWNNLPQIPYFDNVYPISNYRIKRRLFKKNRNYDNMYSSKLDTITDSTDDTLNYDDEFFSDTPKKSKKKQVKKKVLKRKKVLKKKVLDKKLI